MSSIDQKLKELKQQELQLQREKRKVELLNIILTSTKDLPQDIGFPDVKDDVVLLLEEFVKNATSAIEVGVPLKYGQADLGPSRAVTPEKTQVGPQAQTEPLKSAIKITELGPNEKMNFALDNRHLAGKKVSVANDKGVTIHGTVVGLDAPNAVIKTETGPTIKVPIENVSLL